jgi:hypothetical protein
VIAIVQVGRERSTEDFRSELAIEILIAPVAVCLLVLAAALLFSAVHLALAGKLLAATGDLVAVVVGAFVAAHLTVVLVPVVVIGGLYLVLPCFVGADAGRDERLPVWRGHRCAAE